MKLERLISLLKNNTAPNYKVIAFPNFGKLTENTESFILDQEDIQYLLDKYSKLYKAELEQKLKQLENDNE